MVREAISKVVEGGDLTREEAVAAMNSIMTGEATPAQVASFLTALRLKGETVEEIAGFAQVMRSKVNRVIVPAGINRPVVDVVGTGGDGQHTFNISTTAAFVVAGAGAVVAKHGNRAASSKCGSADVLEALGININLTAEQVATCLQEAGFGFMFAPLFHPSMKYAAPVRREIGIRTVFNILGPLTNPAGVSHQLIGVPGERIAAKIAQAVDRLETEHALVVHSHDGLDELSIAAENHIFEVKQNGKIKEYTLSPEDVGLTRARKEVMAGGTAQENAAITLRILEGEKSPQRDVVLLNSAAALVAVDLAADFQEGIERAQTALDNRAAMAVLKNLQKISQSFQLTTGVK
jgi:anthranilate phosphoribosyltransferase